MLRLLVTVAGFALAGCSSGGALPMATTAEKSRPALASALNAWKSGKTAEELKSQSPSVYLLDADYRSGSKLTNYKIEDEGRPNGTGYRYDVTITVERGGKPAASRKIAYRVVTEPHTTISREDD